MSLRSGWTSSRPGWGGSRGDLLDRPRYDLSLSYPPRSRPNSRFTPTVTDGRDFQSLIQMQRADRASATMELDTLQTSAILGAMAWRRIKYSSFRRAFIACATLSIFMLQLASLAGAIKLSGVIGLYASSEAAALCSLEGDNAAPAHGDSHHSKCRDHCLASGRAASALAFAVTCFAILDLFPERQIAAYGLLDEPWPIPGRLNSWSSRAPPFFS